MQAVLLVLVAEAPHVVPAVPPVCPAGSSDPVIALKSPEVNPCNFKAPLHGPLFAAKPRQGAAPLRKTGGRRRFFRSGLTRPDCAGHLQNRRTVAPILTAAPPKTPSSKATKLIPERTAALPAAPLVYSPLPLPRTHPITLTPDTGATPDAAISLRFCWQTHGLAHIVGTDDTGRM